MPLTMSPNRVNFDRIIRHEPTRTQTVTLRRGDAGPITPEVMPARLPGLEAQVCEIEAGEHYELEISVGYPLPPGKFSDVFRVTTGVEEVPEVLLFVSGTVAPRLSVAPEQLNFPAERTTSLDRALHLHWDDGTAPKILHMETTLPDAGVRLENRHGADVIVVTLPAGTEPIPGHHQLTFATDDPEVPSYSVPIRLGEPGQVRRSADATLTPGNRAVDSRRAMPPNSARKPIKTP